MAYDKMKRRKFLKGLMASTPALMVACGGGSEPSTTAVDRLGEPLPKRLLGSTGEEVTMLGVGGYHIGWTTERLAQETIEAALQGGVRFFDTAESYDDGGSETRYGKYLTPRYREDIFLMTKSTARDAATARQHLEDSLRRMKTDYLDLWQIHSVQDPEDVENRLEQGVLDVFLEAKEEGKTRYIGFTGHRNPAAHRRMLEMTADSRPFDTCQMPVNLLDPSRLSFIEGVLPTLQEREIGLLAMKTLADGRFFSVKRRLDEVQWESDSPVIPDRVSIPEALNFAWSLPTSVLITGAENADLMREKIELSKQFVELSVAEREALVSKVVDLAEEGSVEYFKAEIA